MKDGQAINIGFGKNISINELADLIHHKKIYLDPVDEPFENLADISKAKDLLGEATVSVQDWIKKYISMKENF